MGLVFFSNKNLLQEVSEPSSHSHKVLLGWKPSLANPSSVNAIRTTSEVPVAVAWVPHTHGPGEGSGQTLWPRLSTSSYPHSISALRMGLPTMHSGGCHQWVTLGRLNQVTTHSLLTLWPLSSGPRSLFIRVGWAVVFNSLKNPDPKAQQALWAQLLTGAKGSGGVSLCAAVALLQAAQHRPGTGTGRT